MTVLDRQASVVVDYADQMDRLQQLSACGLVTTGRTGSDYLQSLVDSHPEVLTFNGSLAFYRDFWRHSVCQAAPAPAPEDVVDEFIGRYIHRLKSRYDVFERKHQLGPSRDQSLCIDTQAFRAHAIGLLAGREHTSRNVLPALYGAYNLCLGHSLTAKRVLFHHAHHADELDFFLADFPEASILVTTRDPRATFVSGIEHWRDVDPDNDNEEHVYWHLKRILEDSTPYASRHRRYAAIRLEDMAKPSVMEELSRWLGISDDPCLTVATWGGLEWHGDSLSKRRYDPRGWNPLQRQNRWEQRLGTLDKYVLNYLMFRRLEHYGYPSRPVRWWDGYLVLLLLAFPLKYERRFLTPAYIAPKLRAGQTRAWYQLAAAPAYYVMRVRLFLKYWALAIRGVRFSGPWLRGEQ